MDISDPSSLPVAVCLAAASPGEVTLVEATIAARFTRKNPTRLIGDRAFDSDPLDEKLRKHHIVLIAPHRRNRVRPKTQDGRPLRRSKRRWNVERLHAWLQNYRHLVTRYEYKPENFLAFIHLGCVLILLRHYF